MEVAPGRWVSGHGLALVFSLWGPGWQRDVVGWAGDPSGTGGPFLAAVEGSPREDPEPLFLQSFQHLPMLVLAAGMRVTTSSHMTWATPSSGCR